MTRSALLITYEFPPAGGGGVQRMAKFARYLPEFGWAPVVVTSAPIKGRSSDESLLAGLEGLTVARLRPRRVSALVARGLAPVKRVRAGAAGGAARPAAERAGADRPAAPSAPPASARIARRISADDAAWWAISAVREGVALGRAHGVQAVVASGPPFSVTVAGARVARPLRVALIGDRRDAWRDNPTAWYPNGRARRRALETERQTLAAADVVTAVTGVIVDEARELGARDVRLVPNGYDASDIVDWQPDPAGPLRLSFMGTVYRNHSEPWDLLEALRRTRLARPELDIRLDMIGNIPADVHAAVAANGLADRVELTGYLAHGDALAHLARADVAVVLIADRPGAKAAMTGKLFEYLATGLPTLVAGPADGEAGRLVAELSAGWVVAPHDVEAIGRRLIDLAEAKRQGTLTGPPDKAGAARFERRSLTGELAAILDEVAGR